MDMTKQFAFKTKALLLFLLIILSRIPFLDNGFGVDQDACRVVIAVRQWLETGHYETSRLPGYPVFEFLVSLVVRYGPVLVNLISTIASGIAAVLLYWLLRRIQIRNAFLIAMAFAFVPVIYISSVSTMDYLPALAFALASLGFVIKDRPVLAGISLGLAVGCRITSGAFLFAECLYWLVNREDPQRWRKTAMMAVVCLSVAGSCFLSIFMGHGFGMLTYYWMGYPPWSEVLQTVTVEVWGRWGMICLTLGLIMLPFVKGKNAPCLDTQERRRMTIVSLTVLGLYTASFLKIPYEAGYLIPLIPFLFILAAMWLRPVVVRWVCVALLLAPFVHPGKHGVTLKGPVIIDHSLRRGLDAEAQAIAEQVSRLKGESVIACVWRWPRLVCTVGGIHLGGATLMDTPDQKQIDAYRARGVAIYYLPGVEDYMLKTFKVDLPGAGAKLLEMSR